MSISFLVLAVVFLAYSNGANDNFKGVASLFGSRTCSFQTAILCATTATAAGSLAAVYFAQRLLTIFSGKGLVPDAFIVQPQFLLSVALAAGTTVILATLLGFPISTTHSLTGALVGAGLVEGTTNVNFQALGKDFVYPLLLSPLLAVGASAALYRLLRALRVAFGISKELCVCIGSESEALNMPQPDAVLVAERVPRLAIAAARPEICRQTYTGTFFGMNAGQVVDGLHFISAGAVCFARSLNDTPKIAALLLVATPLNIRWGLLAVGVAMSAGGVLNARKVADTMANKITGLNPGQGLAANLATAFLVNAATFCDLPVSTTHVAVGSLLGIGLATRQTKWQPVLGVLLSWVVTLPCAAVIAALAYLALPRR
jgi:PiT family inorganic phosphate transporter